MYNVYKIKYRIYGRHSILLKFMLQSSTINPDVYCEMLKKLRCAVHNASPRMFILDFCTRQSCAVHKISSHHLDRNKSCNFPRPATPKDFHLFLLFKKFSKDQHFYDEVTKWLKRQAIDFHGKSVQKLMPHCSKCLTNDENYVEK